MIRRRAHSSAGAPTGRPRRPQRQVAPLSLREKLGWALAFLAVGTALLWLLWPVFSLLFASLALAYVLSPLVRRLETRGLSRATGVGLLFAVGLLGLVILALVVIPAVALQFQELSVNVQGYLARAASGVEPAAAWVETRTGVHIPVDWEGLQAEVPNWLSQLSPDARKGIQGALAGLFQSGLSFATGLLNLLLLPLFTFYLLEGWDNLLARARDLIPPRHRATVVTLAAEIDGRLSAFVRGQITVALTLGVLYSLGLWLARVDLAFVVGMTAGILFIIPYLGPAVGLLLSLLLAFLKYGLDIHLVYVLAVFGVVQLLEGSVLTPKIVGDKVGLHPMVVMIALIAGGSLLGLWGMMLGIPLTAALAVLLAHGLAMYGQSPFYKGER